MISSIFNEPSVSPYTSGKWWTLEKFTETTSFLRRMHPIDLCKCNYGALSTGTECSLIKNLFLLRSCNHWFWNSWLKGAKYSSATCHLPFLASSKDWIKTAQGSMVIQNECSFYSSQWSFSDQVAANHCCSTAGWACASGKQNVWKQTCQGLFLGLIVLLATTSCWLKYGGPDTHLI